MHKNYTKYILYMAMSLICSLSANQDLNKTVHVAFGFDKPPFALGRGMLKGIEPDLLAEAFGMEGYTIHPYRMKKEDLKKALIGKSSIDAVATISANNPNLFYSDDFAVYHNFVITRKSEHRKINSIEDLKNIKFVSWQNSYNDLGKEFYKMFNPINGVYKNNYYDTALQSSDMKLFLSGKADAIIVDKSIFNWYKNLYKNHEDYEFHNIFPEKKIYPVAFRDKKLRDIFNVGLRKLKQNGRYNQIIKFYQLQNIADLSTYLNLLKDISHKYVNSKEYGKLEHILRKLFIHPDITAIKLHINGSIKTIELKSMKHKDTDAYFSEDIYSYGSMGAMKSSTIKVYYDTNFKSTDGALEPIIAEFGDLSPEDFKYIKSLYLKYNIDTNSILNLTDREKAYIKEHPLVRVHNESSWAPYNYNENDIPKGLSIDYMDLLAQKLNLHIKYVSGYSWDEFMMLIKQGKIDIISNIVDTPQREKYINFTIPFLKSRKAIFSNDKSLTTLKSLNNKVVAITKSFYIKSFLKKYYPKIKIVEYKNTLDTIVAVINKDADAIIENYLVVNYIIKQNGLDLKYIALKDTEILTSDMALGVIKSKPILRDILIKAQNSVSSVELERIKNKWLGLNSKSTVLLTDKQENYIKSKKILRICTNPAWQPIEFVQDGKPKGISIDFINLLTSKIGLKPQYIKTASWSQSKQYLKERKCDILPAAFRTTTMEKYANFTRSYQQYNLSIVTKKNTLSVNSINEIVNKPISMTKNSQIIPILKDRYSKINIIETDNIKESFDRIGKDKAFSTVIISPISSYYNEDLNNNQLKVAGHDSVKYKLQMAVRKDDITLLNILDELLRVMSRDTIDAINSKWSDRDIVKVVDYTLVWYVLLIALVIILIIVVAYMGQRKLKKEIVKLNNSLEERVKSEVQKNKEQQLIMFQQSKLAMMGEMISMIAHQWRQPLNNLSLLNQIFARKCKMNRPDEEVIEEFVKNSKMHINNMSQVIDDFRNFFKPDKEQKEFLLNDVISNMLDMSKIAFTDYHISVVFDYDRNHKLIGYPNELGQVILNIVNNAKDALVALDIDNKEIIIKTGRKNETIEIVISDNGGGIPKDIINDIFDPYFSTKDKNGTGLGLYMGKMIIEDHCKGKLYVKNDGRGAVFTIELNASRVAKD